nr:Ras GTPase activating protein binding protein 1 [Hymenolepis microstoma]
MIETVAPGECDIKVSSPDAPSDSSGPIVRENAKYFIYGFYSKFNYDPLHVVEYYTPDAVSIYDNQQSNGRDEIRQLLTNIKDQNPEVEIRELNAIRSVKNATLVHLIGEFKCGDKRTFRRFTQSLILIGDQVDNFRIVSDITSFAFQIRGIAKKRSRNTLGGYKVMDTSSGSQESGQAKRRGNFPRSGKAGRRQYFKRRNGKTTQLKAEGRAEHPVTTKPDPEYGQQKVKQENSDNPPNSEGTSSNSATNAGTASSCVASIKKEDNCKALNLGGNRRDTYRPRKRWQNGKPKTVKKSKVTLPLVYSSPSTL